MARLSTKEIGDLLEDEILERLRVFISDIEKMPVNAMGIDLHTPNFHMAVQTKNWQGSVGPTEVSHFADTQSLWDFCFCSRSRNQEQT